MFQTAPDTAIAVLDPEAAQAAEVQPAEGIERVMLAKDKLPVVLAVVLVVWLGIALLLLRTERRLARVERQARRARRVVAVPFSLRHAPLSMRPTTLLGIAFVGVFGFFVVNSFGQQVSGYETFTEAAKNGRSAHVVGTWVESEPASYDPARNVFSFVMADENGRTSRVTYPNPKPASFEDAEQVVVEGRMAGGVFKAGRAVLVKCPGSTTTPASSRPPRGSPATTASL